MFSHINIFFAVKIKKNCKGRLYHKNFLFSENCDMMLVSLFLPKQLVSFAFDLVGKMLIKKEELTEKQTEVLCYFPGGIPV